jgi:hypothetical protein
MSKRALFAVAILLALPTAAAAQNIPPDGKVAIEDQALADTLKRAVGHPAFTAGMARVVGPMMYRDNMLTRGESDLILELVAQPAHPVAVTGPDGANFTIPAPDKDAQAFLELHDLPDLNTLWLQGAAPMKKLVDVTILNPNVTPQVVQFFGMNLFVSWRASLALHNNRYIRETLATAVGQFRLSGPETEARGKALLYEAMAAVDKANGGQIPDELYADLNPAQKPPS